MKVHMVCHSSWGTFAICNVKFNKNLTELVHLVTCKNCLKKRRKKGGKK